MADLYKAANDPQHKKPGDGVCSHMHPDMA